MVRLSTAGDLNSWGKLNLLSKIFLQRSILQIFYLLIDSISDLGFKGTYALFNDSPIEYSVKSAGAPATNLLDTKLDIMMGTFVNFQDSVELQQSKTTHEMAEIKIELGSIRSPASSSQHDQTTFLYRQADNRRTSMFLCQTIRIKH